MTVSIEECMEAIIQERLVNKLHGPVTRDGLPIEIDPEAQADMDMMGLNQIDLIEMFLMTPKEQDKIQSEIIRRWVERNPHMQLAITQLQEIGRLHPKVIESVNSMIKLLMRWLGPVPTTAFLDENPLLVEPIVTLKWGGFNFKFNIMLTHPGFFLLSVYDKAKIQAHREDFGGLITDQHVDELRLRIEEYHESPAL